MTQSSSRRIFSGRKRASLLLAGSLVSAAALTAGCLSRPTVESKPSTSNVFVEQIVNKRIEKIDLLFVVDNSISMADKQKILEQAVPQMVERLVVPDCVQRDEEGNITARQASVAPSTPGDEPTCSGSGFQLEFEPINDIHIGVITSSLGGHGASQQCAANAAGANNDDRGYLLPKTPYDTPNRQGVPDPTSQGFLVWHPQLSEGEPENTPVEADLDRLVGNFKQHIVAAGEIGCGFEASLEAWYRFLIDPSPPAGLQVSQEGIVVATGIDEEILKQRAAFLRPDSLVAIVVLTDENDCSIMDGGDYYANAGVGYLLSSTTAPMRAATAACDTNPNDPCCASCLYADNPDALSDCKDPNAFAACTDGINTVKAPVDDQANVRCFQNMKRFGLDLLYPVSRYVSALRDTTIVDARTSQEVDNPLLVGQKDGRRIARDPSWVFFAGITGIPWQNIATPESLENANTLKYLKASELSNPNIQDGEGYIDRWALILGTPNKAANSHDCYVSSDASCGKAPVPPRDPFMIESILPRSGTNPLTGISTTTYPDWNAVNGHEYGTDKGERPNSDLQYSCIFPLAPYEAEISAANCVDGSACDCTEEPLRESPLCRENVGGVGSGAPQNAQFWGKAYPATRVLEVLKGFGDNSIVASICPKIHDPAQADYGYNPAVGAIIDRLAEKLGGQCLPRELSVNEEGLVPCTVVEALHKADGALDCAGLDGRDALPSDDKIGKAVRGQLQSSGFCSDVEGDCKADYQFCEVRQFRSGGGRDACLNSPLGTEESLEAGYCYVDPSKGLGSESLVANCDATQKRQLRFVGSNTPVNNSVTFVACLGDTAGGGVTVTPAPSPGGEEPTNPGAGGAD